MEEGTLLRWPGGAPISDTWALLNAEDPSGVVSEKRESCTSSSAAELRCGGRNAPPRRESGEWKSSSAAELR